MPNCPVTHPPPPPNLALLFVPPPKVDPDSTVADPENAGCGCLLALFCVCLGQAFSLGVNKTCLTAGR